MKLLLIAAAIAAALLALASCSLLKPGDDILATTVSDLLAAGKITKEQANVLLRGEGWGKNLLEVLGVIVTSILGSLGIVLKWRGPITARNGNAPAANAA